MSFDTSSCVIVVQSIDMMVGVADGASYCTTDDVVDDRKMRHCRERHSAASFSSPRRFYSKWDACQGDFTQNGAGVATLLKMGGDFTQNGTHGQATLLKMGRSRRASAVSTRRLADTRAIQILNQSRQSSNHDFMVVETDLPLLGTTTVLGASVNSTRPYA